MHIEFRFLLFSIICILFPAVCSSQTNTYIYVSADSDCGSSCDGTKSLPYATIQEGINNPNSNTVMILSGTYTGSGNINITIDQTYKIITTEYPTDPSRIIIDCEENGWGFALLSDVYAINGLTIKNCIAASRQHVTSQHNNQTLGGALFMQTLGIANISNCIFENNRADIGGAIYMYAVAVNIQNTIIRNNRAANLSGGVHAENGDLRLLSETLVENNYANGNGGGIYVKSLGLGLYDESQIKSNTADKKGNNIYCDNGFVNLYDDSDIDGGNNADYIVCVKCYVKQFNDKNEVQKDLCPSNEPSNNSGGENKKYVAYWVMCLVLFIIGCIIGCCYFYKKRQKGDHKYEGLLEN